MLIIVFFSSVLFFFISSNPVKLLTVFMHSSPDFFELLYNHRFKLYWVGCLSPLYLVLLGFYRVPSFGIYSSVALSCLSCCFYFYVFVRLVTFPDLGEVAFCRRHPVHPSSTLPSGHQGYML